MAKHRLVLVFILFCSSLQAWQTENCLWNLKYDGYCVIEPLVSEEETKKLYKRVLNKNVERLGQIQVMSDLSANFSPLPYVDPRQDKSFAIHGVFVHEDSVENDARFHCIPKSHLRYDDVAPKLQTFHEKPGGVQEMADYLRNFFNTYMDEDLTAYYPTPITARKGSLILWDSRLVRWK